MQTPKKRKPQKERKLMENSFRSKVLVSSSRIVLFLYTPLPGLRSFVVQCMGRGVIFPVQNVVNFVSQGWTSKTVFIFNYKPKKKLFFLKSSLRGLLALAEPDILIKSTIFQTCNTAFFKLVKFTMLTPLHRLKIMLHSVSGNSFESRNPSI